jgi:hypothetical protein
MIREGKCQAVEPPGIGVLEQDGCRRGSRGENLEKLHAQTRSAVVEREISAYLQSMNVEQQRGPIEFGHG